MADLFEELLSDVPVMLIARHVSKAEIAGLCDQAWAAGIRGVEVTIEIESAVPTLAEAVRHGRAAGMPVGAGSIRTVRHVEVAAGLGADFLVSPGLDAVVVRAAADRGIPILPGVATASEVMAALDLGCRWLKAFPASTLGAAWVRAQLAPFPEARFVATGGVTRTTAAEYLDAGCAAVGLSASLGVRELADAARELARG